MRSELEIALKVRFCHGSALFLTTAWRPPPAQRSAGSMRSTDDRSQRPGAGWRGKPDRQIALGPWFYRKNDELLAQVDRNRIVAFVSRGLAHIECCFSPARAMSDCLMRNLEDINGTTKRFANGAVPGL
jgi:hypothetical protein